MSLKAMLWALNDAPVDDGTAVLVLIGLADNAHEDGTASYPSWKTLSRRARCSTATVRRKLRALEAVGLIKRGDQALAHRLPPSHRTVVYDLCMNLTWDTAPGLRSLCTTGSAS